jgi:arylsulfatase
MPDCLRVIFNYQQEISMNFTVRFLLASSLLLMSLCAAAQDKPNILVIWGDDIGVHNVSAYNHGVMGYQTPNIDRIANEGALFTDSYAQQSCTAGRACPVQITVSRTGRPRLPIC